MSDAPILYEVKGNIAQITLNRPDNRNSMDEETMPAFCDAVDEASKNQNLRCLIITGSGNSFCSGADFKSGIFEARDRLPHEILMDAYAPFLAVGDLEMPTIAAMNGHDVQPVQKQQLIARPYDAR